MKWRKSLVLGLIVAIGGCSQEPSNSPLPGWKKLGGFAEFTVEDSEIVGHSAVGSPNTFLATEKEYDDFILEYDFKIDDRDFNSGVQIRSHSLPEHNGGKVFGYQVEIDPREDRHWTAGLYFEGGSPEREAGWLNDLSNNPEAQEAFKLGEWNHVKVVADGRHIQTWLNGVPAADFTDEDEEGFIPSGFIALQVHSLGGGVEGPREVRWKNIQITELDAAAKSKPIPSARE
jgi:hypothetical protein